MRTVNEIIIHCSATPPDWMAGSTAWTKRQEIKRWHVQGNGWRDIGYHALIDRDGTIATGRDTDHDGDVWEEIGAHVRGRNATSLGVCLIGGKGSNERDRFPDHFTAAQERALVSWINDRMEAFPTIGCVSVSGHNEYAPKACPGFDVQTWWPEAAVRLGQDPAAEIAPPPPAGPDIEPPWLAAFVAFLVRRFGSPA